MAYASSASVATGGTLNQDVDVANATALAVVGVVGPTATAAADVTIAVLPYRESSVAGVLAGASIPPLQAGTAVLASNLASLAQSFNVSGFSKVQIQIKNNNAGALPAEATFNVH